MYLNLSAPGTQREAVRFRTCMFTDEHAGQDRIALLYNSRYVMPQLVVPVTSDLLPLTFNQENVLAHQFEFPGESNPSEQFRIWPAHFP